MQVRGNQFGGFYGLHLVEIDPGALEIEYNIFPSVTAKVAIFTVGAQHGL